MQEVSVERSVPDFDEYWSNIVQFLRNRVPAECVEDYAQQTFVNAYAHSMNGHQVEKPLPFLYATARNVVAKHHRDQKLLAATDTFADVDESGGMPKAPSAEQSAMSELEFAAVAVAIGKLPRKCRRAFLLRKIYQYTYPEIAKELGTSQHTARSHVTRGLKLVHVFLKQRARLVSS